MELSRHIKNISNTIPGKEQFFWQAFARMFEVSDRCFFFVAAHSSKVGSGAPIFTNKSRGRGGGQPYMCCITSKIVRCAFTEFETSASAPSLSAK